MRATRFNPQTAEKHKETRVLPGILGTKIGMTQVFTEDGKMIPVTVIEAGPVFVTQIKTVDNDGYSAVQVGFGDQSDKHLTFPKFGHLKKAGLTHNVRHLREFRVADTAGFELGQELKADVFAEGESVDVIGISKGRGFAGGVKRHHFKGQHMTHGYMTHRRPLSSGATGPQRVFKGTKKPGHMGDAQITQSGLKVVKVDTERNLILVSGSVPGANGSLVTVNKAKR
ncbi:MAG: 50S ribosomal protein L3 [Armatimonadetes bacterium]|nr:50S ribosomal protein L3 [Armatimonadota bacterium]